MDKTYKEEDQYLSLKDYLVNKICSNKMLTNNNLFQILEKRSKSNKIF